MDANRKDDSFVRRLLFLDARRASWTICYENDFSVLSLRAIDGEYLINKTRRQSGVIIINSNKTSYWEWLD